MIEYIKLEKLYESWKSSPDDFKTQNLIKNYFTVGRSLEPSFNPEIDSVIDLFSSAGEFNLNFDDKIKTSYLLEQIANNLGEELIVYVLKEMVHADLGRTILTNINTNMFEFAWKVATFDNSFSLKKLKYETVINQTKFDNFILGFEGDNPVCCINDDHKGYIISQNKKGVHVNNLNEIKFTEVVKI